MTRKAPFAQRLCEGIFWVLGQGSSLVPLVEKTAVRLAVPRADHDADSAFP